MQRQLLIKMPLKQVNDLVNKMSKEQAEFELREIENRINKLARLKPGRKEKKFNKAHEIKAVLIAKIAAEDGMEEFNDLMRKIHECQVAGRYHHDFLASAKTLAHTFRTAKTDEEKVVNKQILKCATDILNNNTVENQAKLMAFIDQNTEGKYNVDFLKGGAIAFFISLAIIAAGIALSVTGVLAPLGACVITLGVMLALGSIGAFSVGFCQEGKASALSQFHSEARSSFFCSKHCGNVAPGFAMPFTISV